MINPDQLTPGITPRARAVNLNSDELAELTPAERRAYRQMIDNHVYGYDHKKDKRGQPIEQGLGSRGHETRQCLAAMRGPYGIPKDDPKRDEIIAEYESRLLETEARRRAERGEVQEEI